MNIKRLVTPLLSGGLLVSMCANAMLAYYWIDRSITLSYVEASLRTSESGNEHLIFIIENEWRGLPKQKILLKLKELEVHHPKDYILIEEENDSIRFEDFILNFEHGRLKNIGQ